ncbi:NAD-dependent epimerase/dehydratase family protein [Nostocoides sp. F2B08]|uniref:polysaccharide biosynthesis protein n=1 Tax=Nostocoides sp. F2B08 TaxID=2653936 RepID=UPI001262CF71|nr:nucleoside-diphosphate sugar epimerase/dehydratase [Tetrasphaera sp. F2B08]KAB7743350.1 NAD-dependent epimerase/dehydratase family protein [Tetrasphaera sp. F2B08]
MSSSVYVKRSAMVAWDALSWIIALGLFLLLRHDLALSERIWEATLAYTTAAILLQVAGGFYLHLYLGRSRVGSFDEVTALGALVLTISIFLGGAFFLTQPVFSRGVAVAMPALAFILMAAGRWVFRAAVTDPILRNRPEGAKRALVYGAGDIGHQVVGLVDTADEPPYTIVGFIDDNPAKRYLRIRGHRLLGKGGDLPDLAQRHRVDVVILAITNAQPAFIQDLADRLEPVGITLVVVPPVREMIDGQVQLGQLREFNVADLLGRRPIETDLSEVAGLITGRRVLVTGAGGSIGSELAAQVHGLDPASLVLLDRDESSLHAVQLRLYGSGLLDRDDIVLCDIRDVEALDQIFRRHRPEVVLHAAALKHLPMLERFPDEGWKTNVLGTHNVLSCSLAHGVEHVVNVSTDKAADATSVLGQTKRIAERLTAWYAMVHDLPYVSVRFGNVLGSRGSVLYAFRAQIERGGPVTVTHPDATRYFMTIPEACELVLQAGAIGDPGDVLVLDMGEPVRIVEVARRLIAESKQDIDVVYTGLRPGEKLHEVLLSGEERGTPSDHELITRVEVPGLDPSHMAHGGLDSAHGEVDRLQALANAGLRDQQGAA